MRLKLFTDMTRFHYRNYDIEKYTYITYPGEHTILLDLRSGNHVCLKKYFDIIANL
jgi:hypothetical protein